MGKQYFVGLEKVMGGSGDPAYPGKCSKTLKLQCGSVWIG
jgi:hypothetical protein